MNRTMARYRSKPVEIDAEQWHPGKSVRGVFALGVDPYVMPCVITIHGQVTPISPGDWIVAEPDGIHFYPCKPDIFESRYEPCP